MQITRRKKSSLALPILIAIGLVVVGGIGCGDDDEPTSNEFRTGRVRIQLTDAPFPYSLVDSALVTLDGVRLHQGGEPEGSGWIQVDETVRQLDLLMLQNGTSELLADVEVPVGEIDQIRLYVTEARIVLTDGRSFDLDIPSADQGGIKIFPSPNIVVVGDLTAEVLLDFDVSRSFHPIPAAPIRVDDIRSFQFRPTLHVANLTSTGSISGRVLNTLGTEIETDDIPLPDASVTVYSGAEEVSATATTAAGTFQMIGLDPGEYTIAVTATGFEEATGAGTAVVVEGNDTGGIELRLEPIVG